MGPSAPSLKMMMRLDLKVPPPLPVEGVTSGRYPRGGILPQKTDWPASEWLSKMANRNPRGTCYQQVTCAPPLPGAALPPGINLPWSLLWFNAERQPAISAGPIVGSTGSHR